MKCEVCSKYTVRAVICGKCYVNRYVKVNRHKRKNEINK